MKDGDPLTKQRHVKETIRTHANRYDGLTWCEAREDWDAEDDGLHVVGETAPPESLGSVTCADCLRRIVAYGEMAARRLLEIA